ncbi:MAG: UDP-N-acetylmuramoyl-L-alanyl-D-glutamate--2,6-diaminopimelate ligase [Desulfuromonas thiophila]|jgi:UDP-N-acetylmuramoyl-L-alanyl-D-glutamate--2,6-diaminopimelate ligase|nr:UDP-N-acetylmuramoyl-L-alanyl-D-glutamate--2,6-diaminopimelate ligase [Desulfuromonas thiophila]MDY0397409.1 UDP-N-acetylmuramoyl-L-alanyl-D-glutamate--2,6-diaminopimelate ligase [Desulfuromonas thiophila]
MQLTELLSQIDGRQLSGPVDLCPTLLCHDSRQVCEGALFFALPGAQQDGHAFVPAAIAAGACAVVVERPLPVPESVALIQVADCRRAMARMAAAWYGFPARQLLCIGVTGTNGKTTLTYLIEALLRQAGHRPAVIGTISNRFDGYSQPASHTTPESIDLQALLADFCQRGATAMVMEVSSHALQQQRVFGIDFAIGLFTNLTPEHLDYHADMEQYFAAKQRLFCGDAPGCRQAVIHLGDAYGQRLWQCRPDALTVALERDAAVRPLAVRQSLAGVEARIATPAGPVELRSALVGRFNLENLCCALGVGCCLGLDTEALARALGQVTAVPGRLERIENTLDALVLVDYAHTGDALEKALQAVADLRPRRILTVFGCGGDRDPRKRPVMGAVAVAASDLTVVTSDNPRTEDPLAIIDQICAGIRDPRVVRCAPETVPPVGSAYVVIPDRAAAIAWAVEQLRGGDVLLVAGKGHEDYQIIGSRKQHFDDREQLRLALRQRGALPRNGR